VIVMTLPQLELQHADLVAQSTTYPACTWQASPPGCNAL